MKRFFQWFAWVFSRLTKFPGNALAAAIRPFVKVKPGRVVFWAYNFKQYGCNPRYLSDYLLEHHPEMEIWWVFRKGVKTDKVDKRINIVRFRTWQYLKLMASAEFFATNSRTDSYHIYWHKRPEQKYMMLWHGGVSLKRIERDAEQKLGYSYVRKAKHDSRICDLMISGCRLHTELIRNAFWYDGEVLEQGIPRNDIFFDTKQHELFRRNICDTYGIAPNTRIVLYAPTFRRNQSIEPYRIEWPRIVAQLEQLYGSDVVVLLRLHPNLIGKVDTSTLRNSPKVVDATRYHDMQELLSVADMLITDYSSSMFDFAMQGRPTILFATDIKEYDRGYYFNLEELPFPLTTNNEELASTIEHFDMEEYGGKLKEFFTSSVGLKESGQASKAVAEWMSSHQLHNDRKTTK